MPGHQIGTVVARPTKSFFVHMLTRDIELQDALLDLLDNCVDGIIRSQGNAAQAENPYSGFNATLTFAQDYFVIQDNCGGIPIDVARRYAFAIGKPAGAQEDSAATVGMYGIGMKRAIFKMGREALVESHHDTGFVVEFTPEWMETDTWDDLPLYEQQTAIQQGTNIQVHELHDEVRACFSNELWVDWFRKLVARHYALIIQKGFSVTIGTLEQINAGVAPVAAEEFRLLETEPRDGAQIAPFAYVGERGGVRIEVYAGIYRELLKAEDAEAEEETRGSSDDAGWTVACNDRVVIWKDKTRLTGWGEATVPNYHGQFIAITGIVVLSGDPKLLPLTTTKRGIDASSHIYSEVKDLMRDATKSLTSFTNRWKKFPRLLDSIYSGAQYRDLLEIRALASARATVSSRKYPGVRKYEPAYPLPSEERDSARVSFVALKTSIQALSQHYFDDPKVKPGIVGEAAFNDAFERLGEASE